MVGAPAGSSARMASTNAARSAASRSACSTAPATGCTPSIQRHTVHGHGKPSPGAPSAAGTGAANGSAGAMRGSHSNSRTRGSTAQWMRGIRTDRSSPSRYMALSVPFESIGSTGSDAHSGNCAATRPRDERGIRVHLVVVHAGHGATA